MGYQPFYQDVDMILKTLQAKCEPLGIKKIKKQKEDYLELVFFAKDIKQWNELFTGLLGPALKPAGQKPSALDLNLTREFRGIRSNQTLFAGKIENAAVLAMFWPWDDRQHVTLKLSARIKTDNGKE